MSRDEVFAHATAGPGGFEFDEEVARVFDDMLRRSVPFYAEQQRLVQDIARRFHVPGTRVYDLGCSTGTTLANLARTLGPGVELVGYDASQPMLERARAALEESGAAGQVTLQRADFNESPAGLPLANASVVTLCWTLQFIRPPVRARFVRWIADGLVEGGVLVCCEKVLTDDSDMNRFFVDFYHDFKRRHGYSESEILRKREALENVLVPYRIDENRELFRRNGFRIVETFFQWFNFAGFLCVK